MALVLNLKIGDTMVLDSGRINLKLVKKKGQEIKVSINAPRDVDVSVMNDYAFVRTKGISQKIS